MDIIILAGLPATGKSTLAKKLQKSFPWPILEKDRIKEGLFDTIGFTCYDEKRRLDAAATEVLFRVMESLIKAGCSMIIDNNFAKEQALELEALMKKYSLTPVTVFLSGDPKVLYERYVARDSAQRRHLGHAMQDHYPPHPGEEISFSMSYEGFSWRFLERGMDELSWSGPSIRVDATYPGNIDVQQLTLKIREALDGGREDI